MQLLYLKLNLKMGEKMSARQPLILRIICHIVRSKNIQDNIIIIELEIFLCIYIYIYIYIYIEN